jgi:hypothetical protein
MAYRRAVLGVVRGGVVEDDKAGAHDRETADEFRDQAEFQQVPEEYGRRDLEAPASSARSTC